MRCATALVFTAYQLPTLSDTFCVHTQWPKVKTTKTSTTSSSIELRRRMVDAMSPSKRGWSSGTMMPRLRNCRTTLPMRSWTETSAAMSRGRAARNLVWGSTSRKNGTARHPGRGLRARIAQGVATSRSGQGRRSAGIRDRVVVSRASSEGRVDITVRPAPEKSSHFPQGH